MDAIKALLKQIVNFWNGKEKAFKRNVIIIAGAVLVVIIILSVVLNQVPYATLYSGLDADDAKTVIDQLTTQKVPNKVEGDKILVPAKDADRLRLSLASDVKNGFNLDILAKGQGLGMSESDKQQYRIAQLTVNLQNSIKTLEGIKDNKVMLTVADDSALLIAANQQYSQAGVILTLEDGFEIDAEAVNSIKLFVQKAVPGLKMENISIMDSRMRNLDALEVEPTEPPDKMTIADQKAMEEETKKKLRQQVMNLLNPVFGYGRVSAEVSVALNFDSKTVDSEEFKPVVGDAGIPRTIDKMKEKIINGAAPTATAGGEPGTNTNTGTPTYPVVNADNGTYDKYAEKIQYEITKMSTHLEEAKGSVESLTVAVVVDNTGLKQDLTSEVQDLVAKTVGVSTDCVKVSFMPMASAPQIEDTGKEADPAAAAQQKGQQTQLYIILGAVIFVMLLGMAVLFLRGRKPKAVAQPALAEEDAEMPGLAEGFADEDLEMELEEQRLASIELVKDSSAKEQIGKLIEKNPELVANLLRTWLSEED